MKTFFYRFIILLSKIFGLWVFETFAWIVSSVFFFIFPSRVFVSIRFYKVLFPERSFLYRIWCTWKQYHYFSHAYVHRLLLQGPSSISYTSEGWEYIEDAINKKTGGIILMSHMGNWEIAAHLFKKKRDELKLLLYIGTKQKEQIEQIQKDSLSESGIKIITADQNSLSPFDIIEAIHFLKNGGLVSLTGDMIWYKDQPVIPVRFLGYEVHLPKAPHILSLLSGVPLFIFFAFRTGKRKYHFTISKPIYLKASSRSDRNAVIKNSVQTYANLLEHNLQQHPLEWFHFEPFLGTKINK